MMVERKKKNGSLRAYCTLVEEFHTHIYDLFLLLLGQAWKLPILFAPLFDNQVKCPSQAFIFRTR